MHSRGVWPGEGRASTEQPRLAVSRMQATAASMCSALLLQATCGCALLLVCESPPNQCQRFANVPAPICASNTLRSGLRITMQPFKGACANIDMLCARGRCSW